MNVLGINAYHGDASAALVIDGELVAAVEEERFTRVKHDTTFPTRSIRWCLEQAGLKATDLHHIATSKNPKANLGRRLRFALGSPAGRRMIASRVPNLRRTLQARSTLAEQLGIDDRELRVATHFTEHHRAHIASSFFVSPFERAAVLSVDGMGDMISARWGVGEGSRLRLMGEVGFPDSLGIYYTAITQYLGFPNYGDEYKVMGLASYGSPLHLERMRSILEISGTGLGFRLNLDAFVHHREGTSMTWMGGAPELERLWGEGMERILGPSRVGGDAPLEQRHYDIAASMQKHLEEIELEMLRRLHAKTGARAICLAGGVALNCVVNGRILEDTPFEEIYVQPAANDAGTSVGAAYHVHNQVLGGDRGFVMDHAYWGPSYSEDACRDALKRAEVPFDELTSDEAIARTADRLAEGKIVGWYQGRMEFGPRALGNRSILADPRRAEMKDVLNTRIKHREAFRPFAPSILEEATGEYFDQSTPSPFMLMTYNVLPDKLEAIPAPTHVDGTGRLQTVTRAQNPRYYDLITAFKERTGVPVLVNTSFNDNEPICCRPEEAVDCFMRTKMDVLVLGDLFAEKSG